MDRHVLRLRRTDTGGTTHILLHVEKSGSHALDLKLIATEHEHLYHATIKESSIKSLQSSQYSGDLDEWKNILRNALLQEQPVDVSSSVMNGLETVAAISGQILTITFRKNISGITQRLGSLKLSQDDEREEVAFPEWVDIAVSASDTLRSQMASLQVSMTEQQSQVAELTKQLNDLIASKKEHENELLQKFAALLNSKKLKIRDQQRLLTGANINPSALDELETTTSRTTGASRKGKRKVIETTKDDDSDVRKPNDGEETATDDDEDVEMREETPQGSDRGAQDGDDSDASGFEAAPPASQPLKRGARANGKTSGSTGSRNVATRSRPNGTLQSNDDDDDVEHVSQRATTSNGTAKPTAPPLHMEPFPPARQEADDDETDDDEL